MMEQIVEISKLFTVCVTIKDAKLNIQCFCKNSVKVPVGRELK